MNCDHANKQTAEFLALMLSALKLLAVLSVGLRVNQNTPEMGKIALVPVATLGSSIQAYVARASLICL